MAKKTEALNSPTKVAGANKVNLGLINPKRLFKWEGTTEVSAITPFQIRI